MLIDKFSQQLKVCWLNSQLFFERLEASDLIDANSCLWAKGGSLANVPEGCKYLEVLERF
jgi:hypothetical protein